MSIEETYKGMWSSDPSLLKSLLDAGNTIIENGYGSTTRLFEKRDGRYWIGDDAYSIDEFLREWNYYGGSEFLIPPRPLVLEPKPLEWIEPDWRKHEGLCYFETGKDKEWRVTVWEDGSGGYDITVHYKRANKVKGRKVAWFSGILIPTVKVMAEEMFDEIKSSING